ncbi:hypothetical protein [Flavobacterium crassostreae]|uniref:Lipoprotein n=1 Tax=Flavobacterium crassostreae TaxID=1763534 RepID=A0A1B9E9F8_9FLAO|nr:hypothetical protein [Flavobacterium crassostreae]OCB78597.1 hypothetical protein LPBF_00950 [Flavobacterium crassostreae]
MKKAVLLLLLALSIVTCGVKKTQNLLSEGDYDAAIDRAVEGLRSNKNAKGKQDYVYLLEEAFAKAKERDLRDINFMTQEGNPRNYERIYTSYLNLNSRQNKIRPILPLPLLKKGRNAYFPFEDYTNQIIASRNTLSKYLYDNSKALLVTNNKPMIRRAYEDLNYLNQINPSYKDVLKLIEEAHFKGTDFVEVALKNETDMIIPTRLQNELLDFNTYGMNDKWTVYHSRPQKGIHYDYGLILNFRTINISPEQVKEKVFYKEKQVKDGVKTLLDTNGKVVKDSLGNSIKVDNFKTVKARIYEFNQFKACQIAAKIDYTNLQNNQLLQTFPIQSEFIFQNTYANFKGDKIAVEQDYYSFFNRGPLPFPSNEQMVYDTGEDLKNKLKNILKNNKFQN